MNACRIHGTIAQPWRTGLKTPWKLWRGKNKDKKIIVMELRKGVKFMVKSVWVIALRTFTRARRTRSLLLVRDDSEKNLKAQWNERSHILGIHNRQLYFICINISQLPFSLPLSLLCMSRPSAPCQAIYSSWRHCKFSRYFFLGWATYARGSVITWQPC